MNLITHNTEPVFFEDFINNLFGSNIYNDIPPYNIVDNDKEFLIEFSVPGFDKKDFLLEVEENNLKFGSFIFLWFSLGLFKLNTFVPNQTKQK